MTLKGSCSLFVQINIAIILISTRNSWSKLFVWDDDPSKYVIMLTKLFVPIQATILRKIIENKVYFESNNTSKIYMKTFIYFSIEKNSCKFLTFCSYLILHIFSRP